MNNKGKVTVSPEDRKNGHGDTASIEIARLVLDPEDDKLSGFTRIPLDQVRPCSFADTFADELLKLCELVKKDQQMFTKNWELWHSNKTDIEGIGKRLPPKGKDTIMPDKYKPALIDVNKDPRFKIPTINSSIVRGWLQRYYRLRRSTTPDFSMGAFELASREVETRQPDENDIFKDARIQ